MGRGNKGGGGGGCGGDEDVKREKPLQAVLLADSFANAFRPISLEMPKVLFPLAGAPLLSYSLEALAANDVKQVFLVCISHAEQIQAYLLASGWGERLNIEVVTSQVCTSAGDVMRELDTMGKIESDPFVLMHGDCVSNLDLLPAIEKHKKRRKQSTENIMTTLFRKTGKHARTRCLQDDLVVGIDSQTDQICFYSDDPGDAMLSVPAAMLAEHECLTLHDDLQDCHVDICSPQVLWRFNENFDYLELRKGFVASEVANLDLGQHLFAEVISEGSAYCARAHDPRTFDAIAHDLLHRWVYPIVPELNISMVSNFKRSHLTSKAAPTPSTPSHAPSSSSSSRSSPFVGSQSGPRSLLYKDKAAAQIPRTANLSGGVLIGARTTVGDSATLAKSTVGPDCVLGAGCSVVGSHLWSGVTVEAGATIEQSIVCDGAVVRRGACVGRGCVLSFGVVVGAGVVLPPFTRLTLSSKTDDDDAFGDDDDDDDSSGEKGDDEVDTPAAAVAAAAGAGGLVGVDGKGRVWIGGDEDDGGGGDEESDEEELDQVEALAIQLRSARGQSMGAVELQDLSSWRHCEWTVDLSDDEEDDSDGDSNAGDSNAGDSDAGGGSDEGGGNSPSGSEAQEAGGPSSLSTTAAMPAALSSTPCSSADPKQAVNALGSGGGGGGEAEDGSQRLFQKAVADILVTGWEKKDQVESLLLEVNCFKLAQNQSFQHCLAGAAQALLTLASPPQTAAGGGGGGAGAKAFLGSLKAQLAHWKKLLSKLTQGPDEEAAFVGAVEKCLLGDKAVEAQAPGFSAATASSQTSFLASVVGPHFAVVLKLLYDEETVSDEGILLWASNRKADLANGSVGEGAQKLFRQPSTTAFLEWLEEDDDSEEDSDDDE